MNANLAPAATLPVAASPAAQARGELWRILARALQRPQSPDLLAAMREHLVADLRELFEQLRFNACDAVMPQLHAQIALIGEPTELLAVYSRLFLVPPGAVSMCIGRYLPRADTGESALYLRRLMAHHGVAAAPGAGADDHLVTLLEYLAWRSESAHEPADTGMDVHEVRLRFMLPALAAMIDKTRQREAEFALPAVYSTLLDLLQTLLSDRSQRLFAAPAAHQCGGFVPAPLQPPAVACRRCGSAIASAADLAVIRDRLQAAGLPTEYLDLCPDCR